LCTCIHKKIAHLRLGAITKVLPALATYANVSMRWKDFHRRRTNLEHRQRLTIGMTMSLIEQLDALRIAKDLRTPIERLMRALDEAVDEEEVAREAQMQIEFVQAMEVARKLRGPQVEALYILFDDAVQARLRAL
jgi:hypothetical protein